MKNRTSKKRFEGMQDLTSALDQSAIVSITDSEGKIIEANENFCKISQYSYGELIDRNYNILNSEFHPPEFISDLWKTVQSGKVWHNLIKNRAKDGSFFWVDTTIVPVLDEQGRPVRYFAIHHDVTEQKESEEKLAKSLEELSVLEEELRTQNEELIFSRELLSKAFAVSPDAIIISSLPHGTIIDVNDAATTLLGLTRSELNGETWLDLDIFMRPLDYRRALEILEKQHHLRDYELKIRKKSGEVRDVVISCEKMLVDGRERLLTVIRDETERKRAEAKLRDSEQQMRLVLNATRIGIWVFDMVADRTYWSPDNSRIFGTESVADLSETFWKIVDDRDRDRIYAKFHEAVETKCFYDVEYRINKNKNETRWIKGLGHCEYDDAGKPVRFLGANLDITDQKLAAEKLRESEERLQIAVEVADFAICEIDYVNDRAHLTKEGARLFDLGETEMTVPRSALHATFHPQDSPKVLGLIHQTLARENDDWFACEHRIVKKNGETRWLSVRKKVFFDETSYPSRPVKAILAAQDISERKYREENLLFLSEISKLFENQSSPEEIMRSVSEKVGNYLNISNCLFADIDQKQDTATINYAWSVPEILDVRGTYHLSDFINQEFRRSALAGETIVVADTQRDARADAETCGQRQIHSFVTVPFHAKGEWKYIFTVNDQKARRWRDDEIDLIEKTTALVFPRLERARAEERLQTITNLVPDLIWESEPDGSVNWLNKRWYEYTGQTSKEAVGWGWLDVVHPDDREESARLYRSSIQLGKPLQQEHRIRRHDGEYRWFLLNAAAIKDDNEKVLKIYGAATDIHESRLAHEAIRKSEEKLRLFIEQAPVAVAMFDRDMRYLAASRRWQTDYNLRGNIIGRGYYDLFPEIPRKWRRILRKGLAGAVAKSSSDRFQRADGSVRWIKWEVQPWFEAGGAIGGIIIFTEDVTRIKEATDVLRENQQRFEQIANSMPQMVWTCLPNGQCDYLSRRWIEYTGIGESEQLGYGWLRQIHPEDRQPAIKAWEKAVAERSPFNIEFRIRRHDGVYRSFDTRALPLYDKNGKIMKWLGSNTDITESKRALELLTESEERYRTLFETSRDGVVTIDMKGYILEANAAYQTMLGYSMDELRTLKYQQLTPVRWHEMEEAIVRNKIIPRGDSGEYEKEYLRKDGTLLPVSIRTWLVYDAHGQSMVMRAIVRDITERKKAEQLIREKNQLLEQSYDAIFIWKIDDGTIYWHPNAERLYGYTESEVLGQNPHELLMTMFPKPLTEFIEELKIKGYWEGELIHTTKTGAEVIVESRLHVIRRDEGNSIVLETLRDVTERKKTEAKLARAAQLALVGEFAAGLAHEIKNPLAGIKGVIDILLQQRIYRNLEEREVLGSVRHEIERIDKTVRALLQHSRPKPLEIKQASLNETVRRAIQFAALQTSIKQGRRKKIPIQLELPDDPLIAPHDTTGIEGAILNLILNARDAIEEKKDGTIFVRLKKAESAHCREALIEVEDNGNGIAADCLNKIFMPFQTSKPGGTGLGLTAVRRIVRAHSGECEVRSVPGQGTTFTIRLPLYSPSDENDK